MTINTRITDWIDSQPERTRDWIYSLLFMLVDSKASMLSKGADQSNAAARQLIDPDDGFKQGAAIVAVGVLDYILHPDHRGVTEAAMMRMADNAEAEGRADIAASMREKAVGQDERNADVYEASRQWQQLRSGELSYSAIEQYMRGG